VTIPVPLTDAELIARTRAGDMSAYDELYRRHVDGAVRVAWVVTASTAEAHDVVSEAFTRLLDRLQHGGGPETELSPYLNTIVRRLAIDRYRASRQDGLPADPTLFEVMPVVDDPIARSTDRDLVRRAFETLPDRWQQVLWHTEIEGRSPASLAPALGSTPNAVAALAYRAREGLRQAYLSVHLSADIPAECRPYVPKLAAYVRSTLSPREDQWVAAHLETCPHCRDRRDELMLLVADLRGVLWPALLLPVVLGGAKTAAAVAGAASATVTGISGAESGAAAGGAKAGAAAAAADGTKAAATGSGAAPGVAVGGIAGWFSKIPKPRTLAGQVAIAAASVGAVLAVIVATAVIGSDEEPPAQDDSTIAAPFDAGQLGPPASVPRPSPSAVTTSSPTQPSTVLPPMGRPSAVPIANLPNDPSPAEPSEHSTPSAVVAAPRDTAPTTGASSSRPAAPPPSDTPSPTDLQPTDRPPPTTEPPATEPPPTTEPPPPTHRPPPTTEPAPPTHRPPPTTEPPPLDAPPWWLRLRCQWFPWWPGC
jgi:RNA polymerase sigma factor (sigma-70 family)